jgi:hypothetical protein
MRHLRAAPGAAYWPLPPASGPLNFSGGPIEERCDEWMIVHMLASRRDAPVRLDSGGGETQFKAPCARIRRGPGRPRDGRGLSRWAGGGGRFLDSP